MSVEEFEKELRDRLRSVLGELLSTDNIIVLPETNEEFDLPYDDAMICVGYDKSSFEEPFTMLVMAQEELVHFVVTIQTRFLRGGEGKGVYDLKKRISQILIGYKPTNCTKPIWAKYFGPPKGDIPAFTKDDGVWQFEYHFCTVTTLVQDQEPIEPNVIEGSPELTLKATQFDFNLTD